MAGRLVGFWIASLLCCASVWAQQEWEGALSPAYDFTADPACNWTDFRLPTNVLPTVYHLSIQADIAPPYPVIGSVDIEVEVAVPTSCVVLHADKMDITAVSFMPQQPAVMPVEGSVETASISATAPDMVEGTASINPDNQHLLLEFPQPLPQGGATIHLEFNYTIGQGLNGFYLSTYVDRQGEQQVLASTQMESLAARAAFPCFDEPAFKARWNFSLTVPEELTAISNMDELSATPSSTPGMLTHQYRISPPFSTYLVAWVVGNLSHVSGEAPSSIPGQPPRPVRVFGTPQYAGFLDYALQVATRVLPIYERLFEQPYPLPKLDLIGVPDFSAGAMENWGCITYREADILVDPDMAAVRVQEEVTLTIVHEMGHQWFGDLVTEVWWNNLWLAEGFATYLEMAASETVRPDMGFFDNFWLTEELVPALDYDDSGSSHPLTDTADNLDDLAAPDAFFDDIEYQKGGSVLRMLRAYLNSQRIAPAELAYATGGRKLLQSNGESTNDNSDPFWGSLALYLQRHKFQNTIAADLLSAFDDITDQPVSNWLYNWIYVAGYPLINVTVDSAGGVFVSQTQMVVGNQTTTCSDDMVGAGGPWWVPLAFITRDAPDELIWAPFHTCTSGPIYTLKDDDDWVKLNGQQYGLYRSIYDEDMWSKLASAARAGPANLSATDFAGLLDDSYTLATSGSQSITIFLELSVALGTRTQAIEYSPWYDSYAQSFDNMDLLLRQYDSACAANFARYILNNITGPFIANYAPPTNGRGIADFTVTEATRPSADVSGNALQEDPALSTTRPLVLRAAALYGNDANIIQMASSVLDLAATGPSSSGEQIDPDLLGTTFWVGLAGGNETAYNLVQDAFLNPQNPNVRTAAVTALAGAGGDLVNQTLDLVLTPAVPKTEVRSLINAAADAGGANLDAAWAFLQTGVPQLAQKIGDTTPGTIGYDLGPVVSHVGGRFATQQAIDEINALQKSLSAQNLITDSSYFESAVQAVQQNLAWLDINAAEACAWLDTQ